MFDVEVSTIKSLRDMASSPCIILLLASEDFASSVFYLKRLSLISLTNVNSEI